jgi:GNAT superfamily N-acetyltransferase
MPLNPAELLPIFDRETRIDVDFPGARKETLPATDGSPEIVRFLRVAPERSFIQYHRLATGAMDAAIDAQDAFIVANQLELDWKIYAHDEPAGLADALMARGWLPDDPDAVMVLDLEQAPAALLAPVTADVRPITTRDGLRAVIDVLTPVWNANFDWVTRRLGDHLEIPGYLNVYVAYVDDAPACAGWVYFLPNSRFAGLWGGSTLEAHRGRGLYTAVLAARVQAARARGYRYLMIGAGAMSRPIVAKHGFEYLTTMTPYEWKGP